MKSTNIKANPKDPNNPFSLPSLPHTKMPQISFTKHPWKYIVTHIDRSKYRVKVCQHQT